MKILANDGISKSGIDTLEAAGFEVITTKVAQEQVANYVNEHQIDVVFDKYYYSFFHTIFLDFYFHCIKPLFQFLFW